MTLAHHDYEKHVHSFVCGCWIHIDEEGILHLYSCEQPHCQVESVLLEIAEKSDWSVETRYDG